MANKVCPTTGADLRNRDREAERRHILKHKVRPADAPYDTQTPEFLYDRNPDTLDGEEWNALPLDPDTDTRGRYFPNFAQNDLSNIPTYSYHEARYLFGVIGRMRSALEIRIIEESGETPDLYAFDEETMRTGKNFKTEPRNTMFSLCSQVEWAMSRVQWGFAFCNHPMFTPEDRHQRFLEYRRSPYVTDSFNFSRMAVRNMLPDFVLGHRQKLDQMLSESNHSDREMQAARKSVEFYEGAKWYFGVELSDPQEDATDAQRRFAEPWAK